MGSNSILKFLPQDDGKTHINIYSKGRTEIGRFLSNFSDCNIITEDGPFRTIEGYWYWLSSKDDRLRKTNGFESKKLGRSILAQDWLKDGVFKDKIRKAIYIKLISHPKMLEQLLVTKLPLTHYYVYGDRVIDVPEASWITEFIEWLRNDFTMEDQ